MPPPLSEHSPSLLFALSPLYFFLSLNALLQMISWYCRRTWLKFIYANSICVHDFVSASYYFGLLLYVFVYYFVIFYFFLALEVYFNIKLCSSWNFPTKVNSYIYVIVFNGSIKFFILFLSYFLFSKQVFLFC